MLTTSNKYKQAIRENTREFKRLVEIYISGRGDITGGTVTTSDIAEISNSRDFFSTTFSQDDRNTVIYNYASLEQDYTQLDGTFILPNKNFDNDYTRFIGNVNSGSINISNTYYNVLDKKFTIIFYNGYPVSYEITLRNDNDTYTFLDNNNSKDIITLDFSEDINWGIRDITITINQWSNPNHRFRIRKLINNEAVIFEDNEIVSMNLLEQTDFTNTVLPSNSYNIRLNNYDRKFNIIDMKNLLNKLTKNSVIRTYNGLIIDGCPEYVYLGGYKYKNYKENDNKIVELQCEGILEGFNELQQYNFFDISDDYTTLNSASASILNSSYPTQVVYQGNIYAKYSNFNSRKEQAQALSIFYSANIREKRTPRTYDNSLELFNIDKNIKRNIYLTDQTKNPILTKFVKTKNFVFKNLKIGSLKNETTEIFNNDIELDTTYKYIYIDNLSTPVSKNTISVLINGYTLPSQNISIIGTYFYLMVGIRYTSTGTYNVVIKAKEYETSEVQETITNQNIENGATTEYNNIFIRNSYDRGRIASYIFNNEQDYEFETEILGDPSLEVGDTVLLESVDGFHKATINTIDTTDDGGYISRIKGVCSNVI